MTKTIRILTDVPRCVGHARCYAVAPDIYDLDDNGYNITPVREVPVEQKEAALKGAKACPERIITIEE